MSKQRISRRDFLKVASTITAGSILAACTPQSEPTAEVVPEEPQAAPTEASEPTATTAPEPTEAPAAEVPEPEAMKLTIWGWWADRMKFFEEAGAKYTEMNPNVTFEVLSVDQDYWTKLFAAVPAGTGPTMAKMQTTNYFNMLSQEMILPLEELSFPMEELKTLFPNHDWEGYGAYVIPEGNQPALMIYNKEMFGNAGLDPEVPPKTWDEFVDMAKKLTKADASGLLEVEGVAFDDWLPNLNLLYQQGAMVVKEEGGTKVANFDTPEMGVTWQFFQDAYFTHKYWDKDFPYWTEALGTEKAAMGLGESWAWGDMNANFPEAAAKMGLAKPPTPTGEADPYYGRQNSVLGLASMINRPEPETDEGRKFLEFLYKEDLDSQFNISHIAGLLPAHKDNLTREEVVNDPYYGLAAELVAKEYDTVEIADPFADIFYTGMDMLIVNGDSVETILAYGQEEMQALLDNGELQHIK
jgi:multiple sugar transport system substrate-binding protein